MNRGAQRQIIDRMTETLGPPCSCMQRLLDVLDGALGINPALEHDTD